MLTNSLSTKGLASHPFDNGTQPQSKRLGSADEWPRFAAGLHTPTDPNPPGR
jgi:hypothetical protein